MAPGHMVNKKEPEFELGSFVTIHSIFLFVFAMLASSQSKVKDQNWVKLLE